MTIKMNPEIKAKWLAALRGGHYHQGQGHLCVAGIPHAQFCCLGVLCDLYAQAHPKLAEWQTQNNEEATFFTRDLEGNLVDSDENYLPEPVQMWAGIPCQDPVIKDFWSHERFPDNNTTLAKLNDDKGLSFEEIAKVIEEHL